MKLRKTISWLMGTLQRNLFPKLEESWNCPLTEKEWQLVSILELVQVERFVPKSSDTQWLGRKLRERESIARSFVAKSVYVFGEVFRGRELRRVDVDADDDFSVFADAFARLAHEAHMAGGNNPSSAQNRR